MDALEMMQRIRHLHIKTRRLLFGQQRGHFKSRYLGHGLEFEQLRDYQVGDNFRSIDWKSSARSNKLIVRTYQEERNRNILLLIDISNSGSFGSGQDLKESAIRDIAVMLTYAAELTKDQVGAIFFHHAIEQVIPLSGGRKHTAFLTQEILQAKLIKGGTSLNAAFAVALEQFARNTLVVLISDCIDQGYEKLLAMIAQRNELVVMRVQDSVEQQVPRNVLMHCQDSETGAIVDATTAARMKELNLFLKQRLLDQNKLFQLQGVDCLDINTNSSYDEAMIQFFQKRG